MDIDPRQALPVGSVAAEYAQVAASLCPCGGRFQVVRQSLLFHQGRPYDRLEAVCTRCRKQRDFLFDIASFFGKRSGE